MKLVLDRKMWRVCSSRIEIFSNGIARWWYAPTNFQSCDIWNNVMTETKLGSRRKSGEILWHFPRREKYFPDKI